MTRPTLPACLPLLLGFAACAQPGYRARSGECPTGEVCSDLTPYGLLFEGADFASDSLLGDASVKPTAIGGRQTVTVINNADNTEFTRPFTATIAQPGMEIQAVAPPEVTLLGAAPGVVDLRIADPATDELFDTVTIEAKAIARVDLRPNTFDWLPDVPERWALWVGNGQAVRAELYAADDERLADQSMVLAGSEGNQPAWDVFAIDRTTAGMTDVTVTTGDGTVRPLAARFVDTVDAVAITADSATTIAPSSSAFVCFRATTADATVFGAAWSFAVQGALHLDPNTQLGNNCAQVTTDVVGSGMITASAGGKTVDVSITVAATRRRPVESRPSGAAPRSLGQRAASSAAVVMW